MKLIVALLTVVAVLTELDRMYTTLSDRSAEDPGQVAVACPALTGSLDLRETTPWPGLEGDMKTMHISYLIHGSPHALSLAEKHLTGLPGVLMSKVDVEKKRIELTCDAESFNRRRAFALLTSLGLMVEEYPDKAQMEEKEGSATDNTPADSICPYLKSREVTKNIRMI